MRVLRITMLVLVLAMAFGRVVAMLPPETFKDPIFALQDDSGDDSDAEYTEFA